MCFGIEYPNAIVTRVVVVQILKCYVNLNFNAIFFVCGGALKLIVYAPVSLVGM